MARTLWMSDFKWRRGYLLVRQTGIRVPINKAVIKESLDWLLFYIAIQPLRLWTLLTKPKLRMAFTPEPPRPWYLLWATTQLAGVRYVSPERADAVMYFEDSTVGVTPRTSAPHHVRRLNFDALDVSKSRVSRVFEEVFGYPLELNPETFRGPAVEKSEHNGVHDGQVVECPCEPRSGRVYQRLIDTVDEDGMVTDLRCPTVGGEIPVVFVKRRPKSSRFANANSQVSLVETQTVLSDDERAKLAAFSRAMGVDWGGLDVLRNRHDGRIYVVDVNKTDMGPPTALNLLDKIRATLRLACAFRKAFEPNG